MKFQVNKHDIDDQNDLFRSRHVSIFFFFFFINVDNFKFFFYIYVCALKNVIRKNIMFVQIKFEMKFMSW
jgi:hypothetical protein